MISSDSLSSPSGGTLRPDTCAEDSSIQSIAQRLNKDLTAIVKLSTSELQVS